MPRLPSISDWPAFSKLGSVQTANPIGYFNMQGCKARAEFRHTADSAMSIIFEFLRKKKKRKEKHYMTHGYDSYKDRSQKITLFTKWGTRNESGNTMVKLQHSKQFTSHLCDMDTRKEKQKKRKPTQKNSALIWL